MLHGSGGDWFDSLLPMPKCQVRIQHVIKKGEGSAFYTNKGKAKADIRTYMLLCVRNILEMYIEGSELMLTRPEIKNGEFHPHNSVHRSVQFTLIFFLIAL